MSGSSGVVQPALAVSPWYLQHQQIFHRNAEADKYQQDQKNAYAAQVATKESQTNQRAFEVVTITQKSYVNWAKNTQDNQELMRMTYSADLKKKAERGY